MLQSKVGIGIDKTYKKQKSVMAYLLNHVNHVFIF